MKRPAIVAFSPKSSSSKYNARSISFPARSHPSTQRIEEELNKIKASQETCSSKAETICSVLSRVKELYNCIEELLNLPSTQQALAARDQTQKWVDEMLDSSLRYLDVCSKARDAILGLSESVRQLQSALRRRKVGDSNIENDVAAYLSFRKKMKKEIEQSLPSLKQMESKCGTCPLDLDTHLSAVVRVLRESSFVAGTVFWSLFSFLSTPSPLSKTKQSRWSLVSVMVRKDRGVVCEEEQRSMNELESVDMALSNLSQQHSSENVEDDKFESAQRKLKDLDFGIESLENGLECLFRLLIQNRVTLLNILSQ